MSDRKTNLDAQIDLRDQNAVSEWIADAMDELAQLRAENAKLREACKPFVDAFDKWLDESGPGLTSTSRRKWNETMPDLFTLGFTFTIGDFRRARAAINPPKP
jgi:hypothetical protein